MLPFVRSICPRRVLSFGPDTPSITLTPLNVLIGPNASGKSNLIEIFELLRAAPSDLAAAIRDGGGVEEWLWKGEAKKPGATIEAELQLPDVSPTLRYRLEFGAVGQRLEVLDEAIENAAKQSGHRDVFFYYRFQRGHPAINVRHVTNGKMTERKLSRDSLDPQQSVLSQRKDPDLYPEVTALGRALGRVFTFREWAIGRYTPLRQAQPADLPNDVLLPDARNLGLILNVIEQGDEWNRLNEAVRRFLPRFDRLSTRIQSGTVQLFLHENGLRAPIPATRLSDGTIRFIALLAVLLKPHGAPLICLEEPELGLHPDALPIIGELLSEVTERTQVIVTTQSDVLVSALTEHVESIVVCENLAGSTRMERLETDKLRHWLDKYKLGDIWRMGELGGNP
ncbi:MAG: AAA family ATPase [Bryobacteraceae bacterium]